MRPRSAALAAAVLALPAPALAQTQGGFSAKPPHGSFRDLAEGRLKVPVHCAAPCTVAARLIVPAKDARHMALPFWRQSQLLAVEGDQDTFEAGDWLLPLELVTSAVRKHLVPSLAFPLFSTVRIKVELQADFDEGESATPSVTGQLRWPSPASENGSEGLPRGIVRSISGPRTIPLGTRTGRFAVRLRRSAAGTEIRAGVNTAGDLLSTTSFAFFRGSQPASAAALRRGGEFTLRVPLRHGSIGDASVAAPLAAEVFVDVVNSTTGVVRDHAIRRFELVR